MRKGTRNRILTCPECLGKLPADKNAVVSTSGFIYRKRLCGGCGKTVFTKQPPEEVTGME